MALSSPGSLQVTLRELKNIIAGITGEEHESCLLAGQMEALAAEIDRKSGCLTKETENIAAKELDAVSSGAAVVAI